MKPAALTRKYLFWAMFVACAAIGAARAQTFRDRLPQDEVIYFLLPDRFENGDMSNDRGGLAGGRLQTGFDPTAKGFYHGGDLKGLIKRLDYIQSLGATAIWLGPVFKNKPVQGALGEESAGYHGYWVTDFTRVDPHFGSNADMHELVAAVHARNMKIYLDIITNHTADVIRYRECVQSSCLYRSRAQYPYTRRGGINGIPINDGFLGDAAVNQTTANFAKLVRADFAYTPYLPAGERNIKVPNWLNDPIYYHNRGDTTFFGESSAMGDFAGLDDLMTENPRVLRGFIDIYGEWIDRYGIDGFRIDTAKHVNPEFWAAFVSAMRARGAAKGIKSFFIFGEISTAEVDAALLARHTRVDKLPAVLDFAFAAAVRQILAGDKGSDVLARLFEDDALYEGGAEAAQQLPTFISNHDNGRFAYFVREARPLADEREILQRVILANAMLFTLRGVPVVYYGDEQGFAGFGGDQDAREDLFASQVDSYNKERLVGSSATTATSNFDTSHPLYRVIAQLAQLRAKYPALRYGKQIVRSYSAGPGLFAASRISPADGSEILVAFNTANEPLQSQVEVDAVATRFVSLHGDCAAQVSAPGSYSVKLPALGYVICTSATP